jgi:peptidylprolyl isomerase domain and WD repeat-containing protein 1
VFDEGGNFLLLPSLLGIKVINLTTNALPRLLGKPENTERFLRIALWQGLPKKVSKRGSSDCAEGGCKEGGGKPTAGVFW